LINFSGKENKHGVLVYSYGVVVSAWINTFVEISPANYPFFCFLCFVYGVYKNLEEV